MGRNTTLAGVYWCWLDGELATPSGNYEGASNSTVLHLGHACMPTRMRTGRGRTSPGMPGMSLRISGLQLASR